MNTYQSANLEHCAQSSSIVMSPCWQKIVPACASASDLHRHRPAANSRGLRIMTPTMYLHLDWQGLCLDSEIERLKPLSYHAVQQKYTVQNLSAL